MQEQKFHWFETKIQILSWRYHVRCSNFCNFSDRSGFKHIIFSYRIAMKFCKDCVLKTTKQLESLITIQKQAEKLRNFEIGPSDGFVCQYILVEKLNVQSVSWVVTGNFYTETVNWWVAVIVWGPEGDHCCLMSEGACQRDCIFFMTQSKKSKLRRRFHHVLINSTR